MDFNFLNGFTEWFFHNSTTQKQRWITWIYLGGLLLGGAYLWGEFLNWGNISFTFSDWAGITAPRLAFLRDAMLKHVLPLHISYSSTLQAPTDRFLSLPNVFMGPTVILLRYLTIQKFIIFQTILMVVVGFAGLLVLRKQLNLSPFAFTILFFLFNFNGHILSHYSVGNFEWCNYFLFAWFAALIVELLQSKGVGWAWVTKMTLVLFFMFLQGAFHFFLYSLTFLLVLGIFAPKYFLTMVKAIAASCLISAVRIAPTLLVAGALKVYYLGGYPMVQDLWNALVLPTFPGGPSNTLNGVNAGMGNWEYTIYIGLIGAVFLIYFGFYRTLRKDRSPAAQTTAAAEGSTKSSPYRVLLLPCLVFTLFSFTAVFQELRVVLKVPPLTGERVATRLFIFTVLFLTVLAVYELQKWLDSIQISSLFALISLLLLGFELNDLWQNYQFWGVSYAVTTFNIQTRFNQGNWVVANHPDSPYTIRLTHGLEITCLTIAVLVFLVLFDKRRAAKAARVNKSLEDLSIPI